MATEAKHLEHGLSAAAVAPAPASSRTDSIPLLIAVYDFDFTIYNANTDDTAFSANEKLYSILFSHEANRFDNWHETIDYTLGEAHKLGFTIADFRRFLLMHPLSPGMKEVIQTFGAAGVPQFVCSDGNTVFINLVLEANGLLQYFPADHIFANPAHIEEDGRIRVKFFQNQTTHQNCPVNMCKGCVIQRIWQHDVLRRPFEPIPLPTEPVPTPYINDRGEIMNELPHLAGKTPEEINEYYRSFFPRHTSHAGFTPSPGELRPYSYPGTTVYFGDGSNDLCAAKQLRPTDFMAGRDGHQLVRKYSSLFQKGEDVRASQPPFPTDYQAFLSRLTKSKSEGIVRAKLLKWGHYEDTEGVALREVCRHVLQEVGLRVPERR